MRALLVRCRVVGDDLNVGQNYAIRVDQFESKFQTNLTDRIKFGVNIWDQREFGDRQANSATHCFLVSTTTNLTRKGCHTVSQSQSIDWNTFQVTPSLEFRGDRVNVQYSHTLRVFTANDQDITMDYGTLTLASGHQARGCKALSRLTSFRAVSLTRTRSSWAST